MNRITPIDVERPRSDDELLQDCHRVLLPVVADFGTPAWLEKLVGGGTSSLLLGETRAEYVARAMTSERKQTESASDFRDYVDMVSRWARGEVLVAVDQEPWGIQRLHDLVPTYPEPSAIGTTPLAEIRDRAHAVAKAAKQLGVSMFLSPVLDVLEDGNPWLEGRTLSGLSHADVGQVAAAFVEGTQRGAVATVAKHFPGFGRLALDPALDAAAALPSGRWNELSLQPFESVVRAGTAALMLGPAVVQDIDPVEPASTSRRTVETLRGRVGFEGLIVSDDLDAPATLMGRSLNATMIDSLRAGADLLLVGGGDHLLDAVETIFETARSEEGFALRVHEAAARVVATAATFGSAAA